MSSIEELTDQSRAEILAAIMDMGRSPTVTEYVARNEIARLSKEVEDLKGGREATTDLETKLNEALSIIKDCQNILAEYLPPEGPNSDPKKTISKLLGILDGPRVRNLTQGN